MAPSTISVKTGLSELNLRMRPVKHKRRFCRAEGCTRTVKSQGVCQRHGAKPKLCKIPGCSKQAQGNFDGMCKSHFKGQLELVQIPKSFSPSTKPLESVYDRILPATFGTEASQEQRMPLAEHLFEGLRTLKPPGWHRNEERVIRGLNVVVDLTCEFEPWENELLMTELLLLTGSTSADTLDYMAYAWGKPQGFHVFFLEEHIKERRVYTQSKFQPTKASHNVSSGGNTSFVTPQNSRLSFDNCVDNTTEVLNFESLPINVVFNEVRERSSAVSSAFCHGSHPAEREILDTFVQPSSSWDNPTRKEMAYNEDAMVAADMLEISDCEPTHLQSDSHPFLLNLQECPEVSIVSDDGSTSSESDVFGCCNDFVFSLEELLPFMK